MNRAVIYSAVSIGAMGTLSLWMMNRSPLIIGWWAGVAIGIINFSPLLFNVKSSQKEGGQEGKVTAKLREHFFVRYLVLALAFFLVLRLGREQFGSSLLGFLSFYVAIFLIYLIKAWKERSKG